MASTLNLEDELALQEGGWRTRAITFGLALLAGAFVIAAIWYFYFRDEESIARATEDITVGKATINSTVIISGTADTRLNSDLQFQSSGRVSEVFVNVGQPVVQGQVLASLESDDLANGAQSAGAALATARLKLADLLEGSTTAEIATAEQAVALAESGLAKADNDLAELREGATAAEAAAAQQGIDAAQLQLATALDAQAKLTDQPTAADEAAAEAAVAAAESAHTAAENSAESAANTLDSARASLLASETTYCDELPVPLPSFCASSAAPISSSDLTLLTNALSGANASLASAAIGANNTYRNAQNSAASAEAAVESAERALDSAEAKLDAVDDGPSGEQVTAAAAAVAAAQAQLAAAQAKLVELQDGADAGDIATAEAAVRAAETQLDAAIAKRDEARRGPERNAIDQARQAVISAELTLGAAEIRLREAQIIAPFAGTVAAVNITPGEFSSQATTAPPIVLLTPDRLILKLSVGETDYPGLLVDQGGAVLFDSIPGKIYPFRIAEIGLSPSVTQGVTTYDATAELTVLPGNPIPAPGMNARGQLTTSSKPDIIAIPPRAIRRRGSEQIVDVRRDGNIEEVVITTGVSDTGNVEVLTGLVEGDVLVVPAVAGAAGGGPTPVPTIPGGIR